MFQGARKDTRRGTDRLLSRLPKSRVPFVILVQIALLLAVAPATLSTVVLGAEPGLAAAYGFDEGSGSSVADASGSGNGGTIGSATWTTAGRYGGALTFNGSSARVTVPDDPSLDLTGAMTLEAWVYPTSGGSVWRDVVFKGDDNYYLMSASSTGGRPAGGGIFSGTNSYTAGPAALALNTWTHLALTYDGTTLRLYANGSQIASKAQTGALRTSTNPLQIGGDTFYNQYFAGRIDEVRVWATARTAAQVATDMATPIGGGGGGDTTPPSVAFAAPAAGSTVSHVVTVAATASDNVGVANVRFFADGASLGTDTSAPYSVDWNSTTASNGPHSLMATATDTAGNATSTTINVSTLNPAFVNEVVVPDISAATTIAFLPDGRMLVGELFETVWVVQPGADQPDPTPFLQLDPTYTFDEQGLMDVLPDPAFAQNGWYYVFYTKGSPGQQNHNRVSRFTASGNTTVPGSEVVLWQDDVIAEHEHHAGRMAFGGDGKLYFTYGDQFQPATAQQLTSYRGKLLRINKDGSVPTDNPFYDGAGPNKDAIWARGLRNPFTMSIDPETDRIYIGDVGGNDASTAWEEINVGARGANYGWPMCEGVCALPSVTDPIHTYPHLGRDAAIMGGFVYRGSQFPSEYDGDYFFGDFSQNTIKRMRLDGSGSVLGVSAFWPASGAADGTSVGDPVKLIEAPDGSLYYVDFGFNDLFEPNPAAIRRIRYVIGNQPPSAVASSNPTTGPAPLTVAFSSAGSSDPEGLPVTFAWAFGDGGTSTAPNPSHVYQSPGRYFARVTVSDGVNSSLSNTVTIDVGTPPTATILTPAQGTLFRAGQLVGYSGNATDAEDGSLPASAFTWQILFHHETHTHPAGGPFTGTKTGTLTIPTSGHDFQGATSYEIILTVTDSTGLVDTASVTIVPDKVDVSFATNPSGLSIQVDGITRVTPFTIDDLKGFQHTLNAPDQSSGGTSYAFSSWSDGGARSHQIVVPDVDTSFVATFQSGPPPPSSLAAAYGFDEGSGSSVADASGSGNGGTIGSATWTTAGRYGGALTFNGSSARVTVPDDPSLDLTGAMTLEAWVYPTSGGSVWRDVVFKGDDNYYLMSASSTGGRPAGGGIFSGTNSYTAGPAALALNTWTHLALTYDGTTLRLYANGSQIASKAQTGALRTSTNPLQIGGDTFYNQYFAGRIDEVRVWATARTAAQVATDMATPIGGGGGGDTTPPSAPGNLDATAASSSRIDLDWTAATDDVGVTGYRVERCSGAGCSNFAQVATAGGTTYADTGLSQSTSYSYRVRATDAAGNLGPYSAVASATTQSGPPPPSSLVAAYGFDEGSGSSVADASGSGNGGTIGSATWTTAGRYGGALTFNGSSARVTVADDPSLDLTGAMTLEAWVYPTSGGSVWRDVVFKGDDNYYLMSASSTGGRPAGGGIFSGTNSYTAGPAALALNTWTHLALTYDGTTLRLYANGSQIASKAQTGALRTSTNPLQIGGDTFYNQYFAGRIDEVRVWNVARTAAQVATDMATPID